MSTTCLDNNSYVTALLQPDWMFQRYVRTRYPYGVKDVAMLVGCLVGWSLTSLFRPLPCKLAAASSHYNYVPYVHGKIMSTYSKHGNTLTESSIRFNVASDTNQRSYQSVIICRWVASNTRLVPPAARAWCIQVDDMVNASLLIGRLVQCDPYYVPNCRWRTIRVKKRDQRYHKTAIL